MAPITRSHTRTASKPTGVQKQIKAKRPRKVHTRILRALDTHSPSQSSHLLALPGELRNIIWAYALTSPTGFLHYSPDAPCYSTQLPTKDRRSGVNRYDASLLFTCHQICAETLHLPLKLNTIVFHRDRDFLRWMLDLQRRENAMGEGWKVDVPRVERWASLGDGVETLWVRKMARGRIVWSKTP